MGFVTLLWTTRAVQMELNKTACARVLKDSGEEASSFI